MDTVEISDHARRLYDELKRANLDDPGTPKAAPSNTKHVTSESHPSFWSVAKNFVSGMVDGVKSTGGDLIHAVEHPIQTAKGIAEAVSHPVRTAEAIKQAAIDAYQKFKNEDANGKAHGIGELLTQAALNVVGPKGVAAVKGAAAIKGIAAVKGVSKRAEAEGVTAKGTKAIDHAIAEGKGNASKVANMGDFLKNSSFGRSISKALQKTNYQFRG